MSTVSLVKVSVLMPKDRTMFMEACFTVMWDTVAAIAEPCDACGERHGTREAVLIVGLN